MEADTTQKNMHDASTLLASQGTNQPASRPSASLDTEAEAIVKKSKRTLGLKLFDTLVYPIFNNTSVFITSVVATYLSIKGDKQNSAGTFVFGKVGRWFRDRSIGTDQLFQSWFKMSPDAAKNSRIVLWSFVDGTLLSLPVKWMENKRENVAKSIDAMLGTQPPDNTPYEAEPKQSWLSVIGGRITTAAIVVSTALFFENTIVKNKENKEVNINEKMFQGGADKIEKWIKNTPKLQAFFDKPKVKERIDVNSLAYVGIFEAVYTSICTAGLYVISRFFARGLETTYSTQPHTSVSKSSDMKSHHTAEAINVSDGYKNAHAKEEKQTPSAKVENVKLDSRIERETAQAIGA
jgi:hypothetical protein